MGMFTEVQHPKTGRWIQFKYGEDGCKRLQVGDRLDWEPTKWNVGQHPDDVYDDEFWYNRTDPAFVVIKDCVIVAVVDYVPPELPMPEHPGEDFWEDRSRLLQTWNIDNPPRTLWKEDWWKEKEEREAESKRKYDEETERYRAAGHDVDSLGFAMARPIMRNLDYSGVARQVLSLKPVEKEGILEKIKSLASFIKGSE